LDDGAGCDGAEEEEEEEVLVAVRLGWGSCGFGSAGGGGVTVARVWIRRCCFAALRRCFLSFFAPEREYVSIIEDHILDICVEMHECGCPHLTGSFALLGGGVVFGRAIVVDDGIGQSGVERREIRVALQDDIVNRRKHLY
jgi:hypothetical protein